MSCSGVQAFLNDAKSLEHYQVVFSSLMALSSFAAGSLEPNEVSSVSADDVLEFLEEHGYFYQKNAVIGELVDQLFSEDRARSDDAKLKHFKPELQKDLVSST